MRHICLILLALLMGMALPALAEDVCVVEDATTAEAITTSCSYLRVQCPLEGETAVSVLVHDQWSSLVYHRDYPACSGMFRSGDIYLPLQGETAVYSVMVHTDTAAYTFYVHREQPLLMDSAVYALGLPLAEINGGSSRKYAVVLDLDALNEETLTVPMMASGMQVGWVDFAVLDGQLTVSARMTAQGTVDKATVYIAADALSARTLGASRFTGRKARVDRAVDLKGAPYAAVMVQLTVSYDPVTAQAWQPDSADELLLEELRENWRLMQIVTANEAVG